MRFMQNTDVRVVFWTDLAIDAAAAAASYMLVQDDHIKPELVLLPAGIALALNLIVFLYVAHVHYKRVRSFTEKVERSLHGKRDLKFEDFREGDFSVLQGDVMDMVHAHYRQEELLEQEKGRLQQALDDISHQIKTPLAAISLTTEQLMLPNMDPFEHKLLVRRMMDNIKRIKDLIEILLTISSMDAAAVHFSEDEFTAEEWVAQAYDPLVERMELHDKTLVTEIPEGVIIHGDKRWMTEALSNVLKNCMEHTPVGGTITVTVQDNAVHTKVIVHDSGMGIAPEDLPNIFKRFYKGKNAHGNSFGIGLALTKMVIHEMGGTIRADNHPEGGAVFTIQLNKVNV